MRSFERLIVAQERRRCVGLLLAEIGRQRLSGRTDIADVLDGLVTDMDQATAGGKAGGKHE